MKYLQVAFVSLLVSSTMVYSSSEEFDFKDKFYTRDAAGALYFERATIDDSTKDTIGRFVNNTQWDFECVLIGIRPEFDGGQMIGRVEVEEEYMVPAYDTSAVAAVGHEDLDLTYQCLEFRIVPDEPFRNTMKLMEL